MKSAATTLRGSDGSGTAAATRDAVAVRSLTDPPGRHPQVVEVVGVDPQRGRRHQAGQGRHRAHRRAQVVERPRGHQPQRVAVDRGDVGDVEVEREGDQPGAGRLTGRVGGGSTGTGARARRSAARPGRPGAGPPGARPTRPRERRSGRAGAPRRPIDTGLAVRGATTPSAVPGASSTARVIPR